MNYRRIILALCLAFSAVGALGWGNFKFAHLTDLHISNPQNIGWLKESIAQINADPAIEFVLVTGDLTDSGDNRSLEDMCETLKLLRKPYHVVSGNHETTWSESGMETFGRLFNADRIDFEHKGFIFLGFPTGPFVRMAYGHVQPQDLSWVGEQMRSRGKGKRLILVTHYPLMDGDVDNWYQATDSLRQYEPVCFIGGHYHVNMEHRYDGIPGFLGRSNLRDKQGHVGYTVYEITQDSLLVSEQAIGGAPRRWAGISLHHKYYDPKAKADAYPSFAVNGKYGQVRELWRKDSGVAIYSSAAVSGKRAYIGNNSGVMTCYDTESGRELWQTTVGGKIVGSPAVSKGVVVCSSTNHNIYGLSAKDGRRLWTVETAEAVMGNAVIAKGVAFVGGSDHKMRAIEVKTGRVVWAYDGVKGYVISRPLVWDGKVIFGAWDKTLYALDQKTGREVWKWRHDKGGMHYSPAGVWPVATKQAVFIVDPERAMTAIDLKTGAQLWRTKQSRVRESLGMSADGKRLYAKTMQDSIVCYAASATAPCELWATDAGFGYEHATTMLPERDGIVYSSTKDGLVVAIEGKTGRLLWEHKVGNSFINTVTPVGRGRVLMTETSGEIVMLATDK